MTDRPSDFKVNGLEVSRLLEKNSRAMVEVVQLHEATKRVTEDSGNIKEYEETCSVLENRRKKVMRGIDRRLRILSQWSDLPLVEKRKLISVGEAYRVMHPPYPTGKDRKRKVAPTDEVPLPGHLYPVPQTMRPQPTMQPPYSRPQKQNFGTRLYQSLMVQPRPAGSYVPTLQPSNPSTGSQWPLHQQLQVLQQQALQNQQLQAYANQQKIVQISANQHRAIQSSANQDAAFQSLASKLDPRNPAVLYNTLAKPETSIYPGVTWAKGKYNAQVVWGGIQHYLGRFVTELEAARAVQAGLQQALTTGKLTVRKAKGFITVDVGIDGTPGKYWFRDITPELKAHMNSSSHAAQNLDCEHSINRNMTTLSPMGIFSGSDDGSSGPEEADVMPNRAIKILPPQSSNTMLLDNPSIKATKTQNLESASKSVTTKDPDMKTESVMISNKLVLTEKTEPSSKSDFAERSNSSDIVSPQMVAKLTGMIDSAGITDSGTKNELCTRVESSVKSESNSNTETKTELSVMPESSSKTEYLVKTSDGAESQVESYSVAKTEPSVVTETSVTANSQVKTESSVESELLVRSKSSVTIDKTEPSAKSISGIKSKLPSKIEPSVKTDSSVKNVSSTKTEHCSKMKLVAKMKSPSKSGSKTDKNCIEKIDDHKKIISRTGKIKDSGKKLKPEVETEMSIGTESVLMADSKTELPEATEFSLTWMEAMVAKAKAAGEKARSELE